MNKLDSLNVWTSKTVFYSPKSAQGYLRGGKQAVSAGASCGASDDKSKASACGASDDK